MEHGIEIEYYLYCTKPVAVCVAKVLYRHCSRYLLYQVPTITGYRVCFKEFYEVVPIMVKGCCISRWPFM